MKKFRNLEIKKTAHYGAESSFITFYFAAIYNADA